MNLFPPNLDLIGELEGRDYRMTAYGDHVALLVKEKCLTTIYAVIRGYLNVVAKWMNRSGLAVNPSKTEVISLTRRYKILDVPGAYP